jgi:hypothetical protein
MWVVGTNPAQLLKTLPRMAKYGSPGRTRTADMVVNSHPLYRLSYRGSIKKTNPTRCWRRCQQSISFLEG